MSHHVITAKDLGFVYEDGTVGLEKANFTFLHGESVAVVGANGAGKSTLLRLLTGILLPTHGSISIGGVQLMKKNMALFRGRIGFVFQNPEDQLFMPTVSEDIAFGPRNLGLEEVEVEKRVREAMEAVGISHLGGRSSYRLSGGEKRAAAIASVLSMQPDILLMDEPTSHLDPRMRKRLITLLKGFPHTKVFTTHDLDMVFDLCERTILLDKGRVKADGKTVDILSDRELLESSGLQLPLRLEGCPICQKS
jgi:cobalt/nickel transport system ATP-binding protein